MREAEKRGWDERTVTVNRLKLLETLKENREKHKKEYNESVDGYKAMALQTLEKEVAKAKKSLSENVKIVNLKIENFDPEDPMSNRMEVMSGVWIHLEVPKDYTKSYDVAIRMAEWEVSDTIELTQSQFQCFVMDDWDWKEQFSNLNKTYISAAR